MVLGITTDLILDKYDPGWDQKSNEKRIYRKMCTMKHLIIASKGGLMPCSAKAL
jgi:hypothetical protein